jgi:cell wall assembly regulator SMI1
VANHRGCRIAAAVLLLLTGCTSGEDRYRIERQTPMSPGRPLPSPEEARRSYLAPERTLSPHPPGSICPTGRPPVPRRDPEDAAVTARVDQAWQRIERWLRGNAPASYASLDPPAAAKDIAATERFMSVTFPADLAASLRRHDGARTTDLRAAFSLPPFYVLSSLDRIRANWRTRCAVLERSGEEPGRWWHPRYVPFAEDFSGDCLVVDQRPEGAGRVGVQSHEDRVFFDGRPSSVVELLEATATALESGRPYDSARPRVTDGVLDWELVR